MERLNAVARAAFTAALVLVTIWWLVEVSSRLGTAPTKDDDGNIIVDEYQRAKDILLVVLPLLTTAIGYWFGAQGKDEAEAKAQKSQEETKAVIAASTDPQLLPRARELYPRAF
jgi:hypothetical protein